MSSNKLVLFTPTLDGGVGKVITNIVNSLIKEGIQIELITLNCEPQILTKFNFDINLHVINLNKKRAYQAFLPLVKFLIKNKPKVILSFVFHTNVIALLGKIITRSKTKLVVCEHIALISALKTLPLIKRIVLYFLIKKLYPLADYIVTVSKDAAEQLEKILGQKNASKIIVIYNPILEEKIFHLANSPIDHPWYKENRDYKIILSVGRLTHQKDFVTLIRAFNIVQQKAKVKLVILGEGEQRKLLEKLIISLNLQNKVSLVGYVENPYPYFKNSDIFVLSSLYEGLPTVLIEALAFGLPIVSTNCPTGPREILENGKYGILVTPGNYQEMAEAILTVLNGKINFTKEMLLQCALEFDVSININKYKQLLNELLK